MNARHWIHCDGVMQGRVFLIIAVTFFMLDHARAAEPETTDEINLIQINIEGTRPELTVGTGLGISAEITNLSKKNAIYLTEKDLTLTPAPQTVILFGAAVGGLFAYFIHPQARRRLIDSAPSRGRTFLHEATRRILQEIGGAFAALLLSTIVTILLSRISETQFFIRVTVSDLWGAITIGFVANYAGSTILSKILAKVSASDSEAEAAKPSIQEQGAKPVDTQ